MGGLSSKINRLVFGGLSRNGRMLPEGLRANPLCPSQLPLQDLRRHSLRSLCPHHLAGQPPSLPICQTRTRTKPMRNGRLHQRAAILPVSAGGIRRFLHKH